jgi:glycosyltransferase involved in cell wall biosynthesis
VHDLIAELFPQQVRNSSQQSDLKAAAVEAADLVMCVSNQTRDDLIRILDVDASKIAVSPLASSIGTVRPAQAARRPPYILYVGQRAGYKNFESLAQAFKASRLLRRHFELVCFGGPKFNARELQLFSGLSSSGRGAVTLLQGDDSDLSALYRNASIFVCPSLYEGFGLPVLEAMSCGCPVVATARGSIPEVGGDAIAYSDDVTAEAVRESRESVAFDEARFAVMRSAGQTRSDDFSWMRTADTTLAAYDRFLRS